MNTNIQKYTGRGVAIFLTALAMLPSTVFAAPARTQQSFCVRLLELADQARGEIDNRMGRLLEEKAQRLDITLDQGKKDTRLVDGRIQEGVNRATYYDAMLAHASTTAQKESIKKFQATVERLVKERQTTVDDAQAVFRKGVDGKIATQKNSVEMAIRIFKESFDAATIQARADCDAQKDSRIIRDTYRANIDTAQKKLQSDRRVIEKTRISIEPLTAARKKAIQGALDTFTTQLEIARRELKTVFKER